MEAQKNRARSASRGPARSSLPHGAGKCPIMKVKLSPVPATLASRYADSTPTKAVTANVSRSAARDVRGSRGAAIAASMARKMLKNGML